MTNKEIVTKVAVQIISNCFNIAENEVLTMSLEDSDDFDSDNLYSLHEEISETFHLSVDKFGDATSVQELIEDIEQHWNGQELDGVNRQLKWVPMSDRSMPYWEEENPDWEAWTPA